METGITGGTMSIVPLSSQPTYKEWKQLRNVLSEHLLSGSQPTYKEWKRLQYRVEEVTPLGSQPTYKEWKRYMIRTRCLILHVPSLPTRNGNQIRKCAKKAPGR